jgi:decaprenyl-phosphate phosphoribosyltransferase
MADAAEIPPVPVAARAEPATPAKAPRSLIPALLAEARPKQWVKNVLVVAAPAAAGVLSARQVIVDTGIAFVAFCLAASGTYFLNDAFDVEADRLHAKKRFRPIAAGEVPVRMAQVIGVILLICGIGFGFLANWKLAVVVATYIIFTTT